MAKPVLHMLGSRQFVILYLGSESIFVRDIVKKVYPVTRWYSVEPC